MTRGRDRVSDIVIGHTACEPLLGASGASRRSSRPFLPSPWATASISSRPGSRASATSFEVSVNLFRHCVGHFVFDQHRRPSVGHEGQLQRFERTRLLLKPRVLHLPQRPFQLRHGRILGNRRIGSCGPESKPPIIYSSRGMQGATVGFVRLRINVQTSLEMAPVNCVEENSFRDRVASALPFEDYFRQTLSQL